MNLLNMKNTQIYLSICIASASFLIADKSYSNPEIKLQNNVNHHWYDGDNKRPLWKSSNEVVIYYNKNNLQNNRLINAKKITEKKVNQLIIDKIPGATIIESNGVWARVRLSDSKNKINQKSLYKSKNYTILKVYYNSDQHNDSPYIETGEVIIHFNEKLSIEKASQWGKMSGLLLMKYIGIGNAYIYQCATGKCLEKTNHAYHDPQVQYAYPNWMRSMRKHDSQIFKVNDPLFSKQWYLENVGQINGLPGADINVLDAWTQGYGSKNEIIAIIDEGLDVQHEDLQNNIIPGLSWDYVMADNDPFYGFSDHGTHVAGLVAAEGGNGIGISGVAPGAGLIGVRLLGAVTFEKIAASLTHAYETVDIYNCSWGPRFNNHLTGLTPLETYALEKGAYTGRKGKGNIYVFAVGNSHLIGDRSDYNPYANLPYTVTVSASNNQGKQAIYSEQGSNIWVNAPSSTQQPNMLTTQSGGIFMDGGYTENFGGTSAAAPQVSGVVALMLEQNPDLGWHDIQYLLAQTAFKNDPDDFDWIQNGAGHWVNHKYGFGRVDAAAASEAASQWTVLPKQNSIEKNIQPNILIPDDNNDGITSSINIQQDTAIQYVVVNFTSEHSSWGDLEITLISPEGTPSILAKSDFRPGDDYKYGWKFGISRLLGESSKGEWKLIIKDRFYLDKGHLQEWSIKIYGNNEDSPLTTTDNTGHSYPTDTQNKGNI